jgi:hypothetical protein
MSIDIDGVTKEETSYEKRVSFTYEEQEYEVLLHWSLYDGFDLKFLGEGRSFIPAPKWAIEWEEEDNEGSLAYVLDELTDKVIEESYL